MNDPRGKEEGATDNDEGWKVDSLRNVSREL